MFKDLSLLASPRSLSRVSGKTSAGEGMKALAYVWPIVFYVFFPWVSMGFYGFPWVSMVFHAFPWFSMVFYGFPWFLGL